MNYHTIIPAVWMIIRNDKNQLFLLQRANTGWKDGYWTVPAGHVEQGESPRAAAIRELKEEANITATVDSLRDPLIYFYPADDLSSERVSLFFEVDSYEGTPSRNEPDKASDGQWFDTDTLPENIVPMLKLALADMSKGLRYSDRHYDPIHHNELLQ